MIWWTLLFSEIRGGRERWSTRLFRFGSATLAAFGWQASGLPCQTSFEKAEGSGLDMGRGKWKYEEGKGHRNLVVFDHEGGGARGALCCLGTSSTVLLIAFTWSLRGIVSGAPAACSAAVKGCFGQTIFRGP